MIHSGSFYLIRWCKTLWLKIYSIVSFQSRAENSKQKGYNISNEHKEKLLKYIENHQYGLAFLLDALFT